MSYHDQARKSERKRIHVNSPVVHKPDRVFYCVCKKEASHENVGIDMDCKICIASLHEA
jgi:hypothetical protein